MSFSTKRHRYGSYGDEEERRTEETEVSPPEQLSEVDSSETKVLRDFGEFNRPVVSPLQLDSSPRAPRGRSRPALTRAALLRQNHLQQQLAAQTAAKNKQNVYRTRSKSPSNPTQQPRRVPFRRAGSEHLQIPDHPSPGRAGNESPRGSPRLRRSNSDKSPIKQTRAQILRNKAIAGEKVTSQAAFGRSPGNSPRRSPAASPGRSPAPSPRRSQSVSPRRSPAGSPRRQANGYADETSKMKRHGNTRDPAKAKSNRFSPMVKRATDPLKTDTVNPVERDIDRFLLSQGKSDVPSEPTPQEEMQKQIKEIENAVKELDKDATALGTVQHKGGMVAAALAQAKIENGWSSGDTGTTSTDSAGSNKMKFKPKSRENSADKEEDGQKSPRRVGMVQASLHKPGLVQASLDKINSPPETDTRASEKLDEGGIDVLKASRVDVSTRLLTLARRGEWLMADNIIRYADKKKLDLAMSDEQGFTPLMFAVKDGKIPIVERLVALGAKLDTKTKDGRTAVHIAAMYAKEDMMRFLISKNANLTLPGGPKGQLPLHMACNRPSGQIVSMVQILLRSTNGKQDARFIEDKDGATCLHLACDVGNYQVAKDLLSSHGEKQVKAQTKTTGDTPLHLACKHRNPELVRLLADYGANPNMQNTEGRTPFHAVAELGDESLLRIFYSLRADANIADKEDKTPLHIAAENGNTNVVEILADKFKASIMARTKDGSTLMHIASLNGHSQTALVFLKRGVPLNMPNKTGALGLHCAASMGHVAVVQTLLSKGTNVDIKTKEGYTALHVAVKSGKPAVVECLLGHGADVHLHGGKLGETALHIASALPGKDGMICAEMLLKSGAEANIRQTNGETALHIAARRGNAEMIKLCLKEGADPVATSKVGESPLHVGARYCHLEACKILLTYVAETRRKEEAAMLVNQQTTEGETAMHFTAEISEDQNHFRHEDAKIMALLLDNGGDINLPTQTTNETVMHYCSRSGNEGIMRTIVDKIGPGAVQIAMNKQSKSGWSPLLEACHKGHVGVVQILLEHHARVDVFDEHGKTGLHLAAENGHMEVCDHLLLHKAFINSKSKLGVTPLHLATMNGHSRVVALLVQEHHASLEGVTLDNQTPLHFAAKHGQLAVSSLLISMSANPNARDSKGQTPLHLAAENDHSEVVKLFLKMKTNMNALTATDEHGFTCAHIAAMKGSIAVVKELMSIDRDMVLSAKTKITESTALHMAAAGGHKHIVKVLLASGADAEDENANGMTALHLAGKNGFTQILDVFDIGLWRRCSKRTGLNPMHVGSFYGQVEFVRAMLNHVPAAARSEPPMNHNPLIVKELSQEYGLTSLHMAAQSGHDGLVRILLNFQGVQVDATSTTRNVIPLHLAAQSGHVAVVGMLLSRSTQQLHVKDSRGRTALHLAAMNGHYDMVGLLIAQGSNINAMDQNGWTALHFATKAGHIVVVQHLVESGADPRAETREQKVPLCFAASHNHFLSLSYLMTKEHDTHQLMEDRKFIFDLMICGKNNENKPIQEFILRSPAPIDTAVKLSSLYGEMSEKEKERARDLSNISVFCEGMAVELLSIAATEYNPALLLKAHDQRGRPFLDVLIENDQKEVVSHASVQRYLTEIWSGGIDWGFGKFTVFFFFVLFCPPAWIFFSLPLEIKVGRSPIIKFICHLVSHVYLTILLILVVLSVVQKIYDVEKIWPHPVEWILIFWLSGVLVAELSSFGGRSGLGMIKLIILFLSAIALMLHVMAFVYPAVVMPDKTTADKNAQKKQMQTLLYLKNQLFAFVLLFCFVQYLDFLTVHHLFGPWAIIIRDLMYDLTRFLVILMLFVAGFTIQVTSIFQPAFEESSEDDAQLMRLASPLETIEMLFFALFGLVEPDNMPPLHLVPSFASAILKLVFGIYMMVTLIVLINLLIAMMSDTYQRIQQQSDKEWKFGRAKLIRQMNKKSATPAPINVITKFYIFAKVAFRSRMKLCTTKAQDALRFEENIDAYSMSGDTGRASPATKMIAIREGEEAFHEDNVEMGHSSEWQIETVIDWHRVVEIFYLYQGATNSEDLETKKTSTDTTVEEQPRGRQE